MFFLFLSARRARKEHRNVLIYLMPGHKLKNVFVTCALSDLPELDMLLSSI